MPEDPQTSSGGNDWMSKIGGFLGGGTGGAAGAASAGAAGSSAGGAAGDPITAIANAITAVFSFYKDVFSTTSVAADSKRRDALLEKAAREDTSFKDFNYQYTLLKQQQNRNELILVVVLAIIMIVLIFVFKKKENAASKPAA